ncbi:MAG: lysylphosphatidylglycerol synthase transmembrane domain-containing protein [Chitinophagaceae bacterium]
MKFTFPKINIPGPVKALIKLGISVAIIVLIVRKIDERLLLEVVGQANPLWVLWALLWFILSKVIAAFRFNLLLHAEDIRMSGMQNLKLYWLCMYYNLLLPGGISGDGYKIKVLMERFSKPFKRIVTITLIDRITGLIALGQLSVILLLYIPEFQKYGLLVIPALLLSMGIGYGIYHWAGGKLTTVWVKTSLQSLGVQGSQAIATLGLVVALGQGLHWADYLILFLISSLVAMIPITIGGAGARELTFLYGSQFLDIHAEKAVAIGFLFYVISTAVSFFGISFSFRKDWLFKETIKS